MNCQDIARILDDGDAGQLDAGARREVEDHLASCPDCARDWRNHMRLVSRPLPIMPAELIARCRLPATAAPQAGRWRAGNRHFLLGTIVAVAAAAATLAVYFSVQPEPPAAATVPALVAGPASSGPSVASPTLAFIEQSSASGAQAAVEPSLAHVPAPAPIIVRVQPLKNEAKDSAASIAIEALFADVLKELQRIPGLVLIGPQASGVQPSGNQPGGAGTYELQITGTGPVSGNKVRATLLAERLGADRVTTSYQIEGDMTSSCTASAIPDLSVCGSPAGVAAYVVQFLRMMVFPPDASFSRELQARLLDRGLAPTQRLSALANLRSLGMGHPGAGSAGAAALMDPATVRGAVDLAAEATDPALRAQVWRTFRGVGHADLFAPLVAASQLDPNAQVRVEAVATLAADFGDDARIHPAFEVLAEEDTSPMVRALARRSLSGEAGWKEYIVTSLKDGSRPAEERLEAFLFHINAPGRLTTGAHVIDPRNALKELLNDETIPLLAEVLPRLRGSSNGSGAWIMLISRLGPIDHPAITDMLLQSIGDVADGSERRMVLGQLTRRASDTRVRAALEKLAAEDPDPELRSAAQAALE